MRLTIPCTDICGPEENSPFHLVNAILIPLKREKKKSKDIGVKIFLYVHYPQNCERERDSHRGGIPDP
jgi:hypothetical protein